MEKLSIILIAFIGLFLFGCTQLQGSSQEVQQPQIQYVCPDGRTIVTDASSCPAAVQPSAGVPQPTTSEISLETELEVCSGMPTIQQTSIEEICIAGLAAKHKDISLCKKLSYDTRRQCYLIVAAATNNVNICEEAGTDKDDCYQQYAAQAKDVSVCEKITNVNYKDSCYSNLASQLSDPNICEKIKIVSQKDSCYFNMAMTFQDVSHCNKISSSTQKENCLQNLQNYR